MRAAPILTALVVGMLITTGSLGAPLRAPVDPTPRLALDIPDVFPADYPDSALVALLARAAGHDVVAPPPVEIPEGLTLPVMVMHLAQRAGAPLSADEAAVFAQLDPRVAAPVLATLVAIDQAWTLRDEAFANVPVEAQRDAWARYQAARAAGDHDRALDEIRLSGMDPVPLLAGAILILDTLERQILPLADTLAASDAWPAEAIADPAGVLRIGGTGDDLETLDRIFQLDPRGNDRYENNASASNWLNDLDVEAKMRTPVGVSVDLSGDDRYEQVQENSAQGAAFAGVGLLYDLAGEDKYSCIEDCQGAGREGVGLLRDFGGHDAYFGPEGAVGSGTLVGILREDAGNDEYHVTALSGGYARGAYALGLIWDRQGADSYRLILCHAAATYGWGTQSGHGILVDEGNEQDVYESASGTCRVVDEHGCNDCVWIAGSRPTTEDLGGIGNDNRGGIGAAVRQIVQYP